MTKLGSFVAGLGLLALTLFSSLVPSTVSAAAMEPGVDYPYIGPQTFEDHKYYYFGTPLFPAGSRQGISISLDASSVSYQSIKATVTTDWKLIQDRQITMFYVLANGVKVDQFEPYFDRTAADPESWGYKEYYYIDINVSDQYIGSENYFQVVGVKQGSSFGEGQNDYVVAWSQQTNSIRFKPLPTSDSDTHGYLDGILKALQQLKSMLEGKLDQLTKAVEAIYIPSPEAEQKFDQALDELMDKLPMQQMADQAQEFTDAMQQARQQLKEPGSQLKFSDDDPNTGDRDVDDLVKHMVLDLTEWKEQAEAFRKIMQAALWLWFFQALFTMLMPKLGI